MVEYFILRTRNHVLIWKANNLKGQADAALHQYGCAGLTQPTMHTMLLNSNDGACLAGRFEHCFFIQRLYCVHAQHPGGNPLRLKLLSRCHYNRNGFTTGDEGQVMPLQNLRSLSNNELAILRMDMPLGCFSKAY